MTHSLFRPVLFFIALAALLALASPQNAAAADLTNGGFETGSFSPWEVSEISYTTIPAPAFVSGASFNNAMGVATNVTPAEGSFQAVLNAPTSGTTRAPDLETFLGLASGTLDPLFNYGNGYYNGGSAIKQTFDVRDGSVISFQWNFLPNGTNSTVDQNDSGFFTLHAAADSSSTNYTVLSTTALSSGIPTGYQPYTTGPLTAGSYLLGISAFDQQQSFWNDAQQPTLLIDAVTAYVPDLYVGSNSSGVTTDFTSGTNYYENTYVGYSPAASNNTLNVSNAATVLTNYTDLYIGFEGSSNTMKVADGGTVADTFGYIGYDTNSSNNTALVTGANSVWTNSSNLFVGGSGSSNSLVISNGGTVANASGIIGNDPISSNNSVLVTGTNSLWTNSTSLYVGLGGSGNSLVISNGATVANAYGIIGNDSTSSNNSVLVTGTNSLWTNSADLYFGISGSSNNLVISNGGTVANAFGYIGYYAASSNNSVLVTGSNSLWTNSVHLLIGNNGSGNSLVISNGGTVENYSGSIGASGTSSNNSVLVTGSNSLWTNSSDLFVGDQGSGNSLVISSSGTAANFYGYIGYDATSSNNSVLVTGTNSLWTNSGDLYVGFQGSDNSLTISNGGRVAVGNSTGHIGFYASSSNNSVLVEGAGSTWTNSGILYVGTSGLGNNLVISNGGTVATADTYIGYWLGSSSNSVLVTGADSLLTNSGDILVGYSGSGNSLVISNGGAVTSMAEIYVGKLVTSSNNSITVTGSNSVLSQLSADPYSNIYVGADGSGNRLTVSAGATVTNDGGFYIGVGKRGGPYSDNNTVLVEGAGSKIISVGQFNEMADWGSGNQLIISNGGSVTFGGDGFWMSWDPLSVSNSIVVTGSNSSFTTAGNTYLGKSGSGNTVLVADGAVFNSGSSWVSDKFGADIASNNSVLVTGAGSVWSNSGTLTIGSAGSGTLTIANGGKVVAANTKIGDLAGSAGTINVGTLGGNDTNVTLTTPSIQFGAGTGALNLNQSDRMTLSAILSGGGELNQLGTGTTELTGYSTYTGPTAVEAGKLVVSGAISNSAVTVSGVGTLGGSGTVGALTISNGGTVNPGSSPGTLTIEGDVTWSGGGNYNWQIYDAVGVAGATNGWDLIYSTGSLNLGLLSDTNRFNINLWTLSGISPDTDGSAINFINTQSYRWTILSASNGITGFASNNFNVNLAAINGTAGWANNLGGGLIRVEVLGNNLDLVFDAADPGVPEPGTWAAGALLAVAAAFARWRRRTKAA